MPLAVVAAPEGDSSTARSSESELQYRPCTLPGRRGEVLRNSVKSPQSRGASLTHQVKTRLPRTCVFGLGQDPKGGPLSLPDPGSRLKPPCASPLRSNISTRPGPPPGAPATLPPLACAANRWRPLGCQHRGDDRPSLTGSTTECTSSVERSQILMHLPHT